MDGETVGIDEPSLTATTGPAMTASPGCNCSVDVYPIP
jgi:hypothetical protein